MNRKKTNILLVALAIIIALDGSYNWLDAVKGALIIACLISNNYRGRRDQK